MEVGSGGLTPLLKILDNSGGLSSPLNIFYQWLKDLANVLFWKTIHFSWIWVKL